MTHDKNIEDTTKLVNKTQLKKLGETFDLRVGEEAIERLAERFYHITVMAARRAKKNDRKTIMDRDV